MEQTDRKCVYRKLYTVEQDSDGLTAAKIATIAIIRLLYMKYAHYALFRSCLLICGITIVRSLSFLFLDEFEKL